MTTDTITRGTNPEAGFYEDSFYRHDLLTPEQEVILGDQVQAGIAAGELLANQQRLADSDQIRKLEDQIRLGLEAEDLFIRSNLRLVAKIASNHFSVRSEKMDVEDAQQNGMLGLMRAVKKFDPTMGFKFSTYATWWIKQAITRDSLNDTAHGVHISQQMMIEFIGIKNTARSMSAISIDQAVITESGSNLTLEEFRWLEGFIDSGVSLDAPISTENATSIVELMPNDFSVEEEVLESVAAKEMKTLIDEVFELLIERYEMTGNGGEAREMIKVVKLYYGFGGAEPMTKKRIVEELKSPRHLVDRRLRQANDLMREIICEYGLEARFDLS